MAHFSCKRHQKRHLEFYYALPSKQRVGGSSPSGRAIFSGSGPDTWVTERTGHMGND